MPAFIVRVEMHGATETEYNILHLDMEQNGFASHIAGDDGRLYRLPSATYAGSTNGAAISVKDRVQTIAMRVHQNPWVIVCDYVDAAWNLPLVHST